MVVAVASELPPLSRQMEKIKRTGKCDFCDNTVVYNRENYKEQRQKGYNPVLCCMTCYQNGNHIRQGYRG